MNKKGLSLVELFLTLSVLSLLIGIGSNGFNSLIEMSKAYSIVKTVRNSFVKGMYKSYDLNVPIKVRLKDNKITFYKSSKNKWKEIESLKLKNYCNTFMNISPVFFPNGYVSPTCSVYIISDNYKYKITISFYGRIKVIRIS